MRAHTRHTHQVRLSRLKVCAQRRLRHRPHRRVRQHAAGAVARVKRCPEGLQRRQRVQQGGVDVVFGAGQVGCPGITCITWEGQAGWRSADTGWKPFFALCRMLNAKPPTASPQPCTCPASPRALPSPARLLAKTNSAHGAAGHRRLASSWAASNASHAPMEWPKSANGGPSLRRTAGTCRPSVTLKAGGPGPCLEQRLSSCETHAPPCHTGAQPLPPAHVQTHNPNTVRAHIISGSSASVAAAARRRRLVEHGSPARAPRPGSSTANTCGDARRVIAAGLLKFGAWLKPAAALLYAALAARDRTWTCGASALAHALKTQAPWPAGGMQNTGVAADGGRFQVEALRKPALPLLWLGTHQGHVAWPAAGAAGRRVPCAAGEARTAGTAGTRAQARTRAGANMLPTA